jgi:hypothetical protein
MSIKYEIFTPTKLIGRCIFTNIFKKSKKKLRLSDPTQTDLSTVQTFNPLGVKVTVKFLAKFSCGKEIFSNAYAQPLTV